MSHLESRSLAQAFAARPRRVDIARPWDLAATPEQLALARGMVWRRKLEAGEAQSMREIARREDMDGSYVARLVGLTLVSPWEVAEVLG